MDAAVSRPGSLATVDLDTGKVTKIAELDMTNKVFAMAIDKNGTMYVAGSADYYTDAVLYTMDKTTGALRFRYRPTVPECDLQHEVCLEGIRYVPDSAWR